MKFNSPSEALITPQAPPPPPPPPLRKKNHTHAKKFKLTWIKEDEVQLSLTWKYYSSFFLQLFIHHFIVVNFLSQVFFYVFIQFQLHQHTLVPYPKSKEKQKLREIKINCNKYTHFCSLIKFVSLTKAISFIVSWEGQKLQEVQN